jgi:hypothetical protein
VSDKYHVVVVPDEDAPKIHSFDFILEVAEFVKQCKYCNVFIFKGTRIMTTNPPYSYLISYDKDDDPIPLFDLKPAIGTINEDGRI